MLNTVGFRNRGLRVGVWGFGLRGCRVSLLSRSRVPDFRFILASIGRGLSYHASTNPKDSNIH